MCSASTLGAADLVLHAGTLRNAGFVELCDAAVAGGFTAITLYPTHALYVDAVTDSVGRIVDEGFVLPYDGALIIEAARTAPIPN